MASTAHPPRRSRPRDRTDQPSEQSIITKQTRSRISQKRLDAFIETLGATSNIARSAQMAGISETTARRYRRNDKDFAQRWERALADGVADLRMRAVEQARFGATTVESVAHNGETRITTTVRQCAVQSLREIERMLECRGEAARISDARDKAAYDIKVERLTVEAIALVIEKMARELQNEEQNGNII